MIKSKSIVKNVLILVPDGDLYNGKVLHKVKTNIYIYIYIYICISYCAWLLSNHQWKSQIDRRKTTCTVFKWPFASNTKLIIILFAFLDYWLNVLTPRFIRHFFNHTTKLAIPIGISTNKRKYPFDIISILIAPPKELVAEFYQKV